MRVLALTLTIFLAFACSGGTEPEADAGAARTADAPTREPATEPPAEADGEQGKLVGNSKLIKVMTEDWKPIEGYTRQFYDGELDALYENFSDAAKEEFSMQDLVALHEMVRTEYGNEVDIVASRREEKDGYQAFFRAVKFSLDDRLIEVAWVIGSDDSISGLYITPDRSSDPEATD